MNPFYNTLDNNDFMTFPYPATEEKADILENTMSLYMYNTLYYLYFKRLLVAIWKYKGLPDYIKQKNAEEPLILYGKSAGFINKEGVIDLMGFTYSEIDRYGNPLKITPQSPYDKNYTDRLDIPESDFSVVLNNSIGQPSQQFLFFLTSRLSNIERQIDINLLTQKNPRIWLVPEKQKLAFENIINDVNSNKSDIILTDEYLFEKMIKVNQTNTMYIADKLEELKFNVINDLLTMFGISNIGAVEKKERLITAEVQKNNVVNNLMLNDMLEARKIGYEGINKMFDTNIEVSVNELIELDTSEFELREDIEE